ncbi:GNAT family N-acetyltransferase [Sphingomonas paeninsulae]|uniref:GNAT family N-acetyltransferase n=1 Tax=Sphingomonas paeninsulae TaxID=2319844 RepID=A0A494T8Y7_SPHPE|nr:GNAT family N-acetyltransferase [Sphingomonas paeninsulae]AYJ85809.1 GNAT family N-acetyltransferase [Sphingomonas paeninsulae]
MIAANFRTATAADIPALHRLIERAYRGDSARKGWTHEADLLGGQRTDIEALADLLADPGQCMIVANVGGALVGCVQIASAGKGVAYLGHLSVDPEIQGGGLGRRLVGAAESAAIEAFNADAMEMTVIRQRTELIDWYCRLGYSLTNETRPFPSDNPRFGVPKIQNLDFVVLVKAHLRNDV